MDIKSKYKLDRLFIGSYGTVLYIPRVDLLSQLSIDLHSLKSQANNSSKVDFSGYKIKTPVPPHPSEGMVNPRTTATFPIGTKTDPSTGESLVEVESTIEERSVRNQIIYTDIDYGTIYFIDKSGYLDTHNIGHVSQLSENTGMIVHTLDSKVNAPSSFRTVSGEEKKWDPSPLEQMFHVDSSDNSPEASARREKIKSISSVDLSRDGGIPLFMYSRNPDFRSWVDTELLKIEDKISRGVLPVHSRGGKTSQLSSNYANLVAAVLLSDKHAEYYKEQKAAEDESLSVDSDEAPEIPHISSDVQFLPHQAYALSFLKEKKAAMIDADPGAGKTLMMLSDVLDKLGRGLVRRPCIVMPNALLSQQKREMEEWTRGGVNFVVINTDTVRQMDPSAVSKRTGLPRKGVGDSLKGLNEIKKLLQSAPPNTIILTSYSWIRGGSEDQVETGSGTTFRRASWLTTWAGVDMLVLDESHNVRIGSSGKQSKKAQAIMQMSRLVPFKRCYTGTSAPSGPDDIFLQMNFLDPSVLGDRKSFLEKYALSQSSGKRKSGRVEEFKPGAIKQIRNRINKSAGLAIRRSAWLGQLPQLQVEYHQAKLTAPQKVVYERLMDRIIHEELLGDAAYGSVGLSLQRELRDANASNPVARAQLDSWQPPSSATVVEYDEGEDEMVEIRYDLQDENKKKALAAAQERIRRGLEKFEATDSEEEDFLPLLQKFIAVDKFLNNPQSDEYGQTFLFDDRDKVSPKVGVINDILDSHFSDPSNGKVIIFTQYKEVASHILDNMNMASSAVYYDSSQSKNLDKFKQDDNVKIIVAVEQSIREGQNLQMANRIIRVDLPWNPGDYEQTIARAYRLPPRDPDAARFSVVHVDLILTEGTAEVTKYMRMVSKMHKIRQLTSDFTAERSFPLVGMSLRNMQTKNTFEQMSVYQDVYSRIQEQEIEEAKKAPQIFGSESKELATGEEIEGSEQIETPYVSSDEDLSPWVIDPTRYATQLINPVFIYFNSAFWLALKFDPQMKRVLSGFSLTTNTRFFYKGFSTAAEAINILKSIQNHPQHPLRIVNAQEILPKIYGQAPVDPSFPGSTIDYGNLVKSAAAPPSDFRPTSPTYSKEVLGYQPSQEDRQISLALLQRAAHEAGGKKITPIHALAAAKIFGYLDLDADDLDISWLWKNSRHFAMIRAHKGILVQQLDGPNTSPSAPVDNEVTTEKEDSPIPGVTDTDLSGGVPIQLEVSVLGAISGSQVAQRPCFTISDASFTLDGLQERVLSVLKDHGFKSWDSSQTWLYMGQTRTEAASSIKKFAKRLYIWRYYLEDPDAFEQQIAKFGLSLDQIWPKKEVAAMRKVAAMCKEYPEYRRSILDAYSEE
tara:strand:- start:2068 stop:6138 length:4071 start_codon:yes stop_codon:yes gene_type:complete